jgi:WD40 repeat protein
MAMKQPLVATGAGDMVLLWNLDPTSSLWFGERNEMTGHLKPVTTVQFFDENKLASGSEDSTVKLWGIVCKISS